MLKVFLEVVLPVALIAIAGGIIGRWRGLTVAPISALVFYLFGPSLVFHSLATTEVPADVSAKIVAVMVAAYVAMYAASTAWSLARRHDPSLRAAFALAATTPNVGNMGLPVALLAFGQAGLDIAVMNFVVGAVMAYSCGVAVASMAGGSAKAALSAPLRYPVVYAAVAGATLNALNIDLPVTLDVPFSTLADAAVPVMLVVLGLQLRHAFSNEDILDTVVVNAGRLLIAPVVAWFTATALGLDGTTRATLVVLAAMPTAVIATILATEFNAKPSFVTRAVVTSTLVSMLTVTALITLVQ